jgi:hypothetical protein
MDMRIYQPRGEDPGTEIYDVDVGLGAERGARSDLDHPTISYEHCAVPDQSVVGTR